jgi:DNA polymerase
MATKVFRREISKSDKLERQLGKTIILGCGYGLGYKKFGAILAAGPFGFPPILFTEDMMHELGIPIDMEGDETITKKLTGRDLQAHTSMAKYLIDTYRTSNPTIPDYWKKCEGMLRLMYRGATKEIGPIQTGDCCLILPNGLKLQYKNLQQGGVDNSWRYEGKRGETQYIYGGKLCENIDQALSRIILTDAAVEMQRYYPVVLRVHDELVCCVREKDADDCLEYMLDVMRTPPAWAPDLPLDAEGGINYSYGEAK